MSESEHQYPIVNNYLFFKELYTDSIGVNYRAGEIDKKERKATGHCQVTEVYPLLSNSPNIWKRVNILLEGVKKSNIPKLFSPDKIIHEDDRTLLVYPLFNGRTFEAVLDESFRVDNPINFDLAFSIAFSIADLIDVGSSIVVSGEKSFHGFLTPDNILIDYDGKILLKNYGIFPYLSREEDIYNEMVTKYGSWIAPEFLRKEKLVSQTDIYHLGYILYKILTGQYFSCSPEEDFDSKFSNISFNQHIPSSDKEFLTNIITFFKKTLHPEPGQRFANIKVLKDYISNNFHIEELSSVTFNLAYFMNSLFLESMEGEKEAFEKELAYRIPEEKKPEPKPAQPSKGSDELVADILTGLDEVEKKSSRSKMVVPLLVVIVLVIAASAYFIITQQQKAQEENQARLQRIEQQRIEAEKQMKEKMEAEFQKRLKEIQDSAADTEEAKKQQQDKLAKLEEWKAEQERIARNRQKAEEDRLAKIAKDKEALKAKEAEMEKQKLEAEKQKEAEAEKIRLAQEAEKQKQQEEANKKKAQQEATKAKPGQLVSLGVVDERPKQKKGRVIQFNTPLRSKYRGNRWSVRVMLMITETGTVGNIRIISKVPSDIKAAIERQLEKWNYTPAIKDGVKVKVWQPINFTIDFK
jgi:serine/threonine protein kinase